MISKKENPITKKLRYTFFVIEIAENVIKKVASTFYSDFFVLIKFKPHEKKPLFAFLVFSGMEL